LNLFFRSASVVEYPVLCRFIGCFSSESCIEIFAGYVVYALCMKECVCKQVEEGWWEGTLNGKTGVFPSNFVEVEEAGEAAEADGNKTAGTGKVHTR
jgi:hypothetical protein